MKETVAVIEDHLAKRLAKRIDEDIKANYDENVLMLTGRGMFMGHKGVKRCAEELNDAIENPHFVYNKILTEDRFAYLEWVAESEDKEITDGADSLVVENGKIVFQSVHYTVHNKKLI